MATKNTNEPTNSIAQNKLLLLSFVEGSCVMIAELAGGKMLAPFFGSSLYVWASTLAITLGALTIGYYIGGELSKQAQAKRNNTLFTIIAAAAALVIIMPLSANTIMSKAIEMPFLAGMIISQLFFLLPPILCMGIVSPMLIGLIGENNPSGKAAGLVYAVSTSGGVIATLITGFWLVPVAGIAIPCVVAGILLFALNLFILRPKKKTGAIAVIVLLIPSSFFIYNNRQDNTYKYDILYHSEGILGQIKVMDFEYRLRDKTFRTRSMLVNHIWQTWINSNDNDFSLLFYTRFSRALISTLPEGSNALLIGLGGGSVAKQLENKNINYDAVEIDGRLPELAEKYFGLKSAVANTTIDDGRHFINVCKKKYDLVIIDALLGDSVPSYLLSLECFNKIKDLLNPDGKIFIEFDGFEEGTNGMAQQLLLNTIQKSGLTCQTYATVRGSTKGDIMYIAGIGDNKNYDTAHVIADFFFPVSGQLSSFAIDLPNTTKDIITDDYPVVDFYIKDHVASFRQEYMIEYDKDFLMDNVPFFH
ncbi:MAG: fused MFS/spermidine synthase [Chitinophagales bacterium]|nr:fused MFS/spermidine synthase [Chitinophagales bacterium]